MMMDRQLGIGLVSRSVSSCRPCPAFLMSISAISNSILLDQLQGFRARLPWAGPCSLRWRTTCKRIAHHQFVIDNQDLAPRLH